MQVTHGMRGAAAATCIPLEKLRPRGQALSRKAPLLCGAALALLLSNYVGAVALALRMPHAFSYGGRLMIGAHTLLGAAAVRYTLQVTVVPLSGGRRASQGRPCSAAAMQSCSMQPWRRCSGGNRSRAAAASHSAAL